MPSCSETPPPPNAQVLIPGGAWTHRDGSPSRWSQTSELIEVAPGSGDVIGGTALSDFQLHLEFWLPLLLLQDHGAPVRFRNIWAVATQP